jgi:hypothetical protein
MWFIDIADFDGDGKLDIATQDYGSSRVHVFKNTTSSSTISFTYVNSFSVGSSTEGLKVGDLNGEVPLLVFIQETAAKKIQSIYRGTKTRQHLNNNIDFQDKIDKRIKQYSNAASEYRTRGADKQNINDEFYTFCNLNILIYEFYLAAIKCKHLYSLANYPVLFKLYKII